MSRPYRHCRTHTVKRGGVAAGVFDDDPRRPPFAQDISDRTSKAPHLAQPPVSRDLVGSPWQRAPVAEGPTVYDDCAEPPTMVYPLV
jgi:hypothetical protein